MSFLDNLESTLKNLESANEKDKRNDRLRQQERANARAAAPFSEQLKKGPFANEFLTHAVRLGHSTRTKVTPTWVGNILRVDARERRLELRPTADGIVAVFMEDGTERSSEVLDLKKAKPEKLAERWLG